MEGTDSGLPAQQKKKRNYAAQAYEFGANAQNQGGQPSLAGNVPPGAAYGTPDTLTQQFGQMDIQQPPMPQQQHQQNQQQQQQQHVPQQAQQQAAPQQTAQLNQLYPSDLISQPFNVNELDLPPPPINLPPNVAIQKKIEEYRLLTFLDIMYAQSVCELRPEICQIDP
jgi:protein transport protein SEC24